jgi:hypothetical protein
VRADEWRLWQVLKVADVKGDGVLDLEELFVLNEKLPTVRPHDHTASAVHSIAACKGPK